MLDPFSRGAIVALTALCVLGAVELPALPARSFLAPNPLHEPQLARASASGILPIARDPFAQPPAAGELGSTALGPAQRPPFVRASLAALPSNLMNDAIPGLPGAPPDPGPSTDPDGSAQRSGSASRITAIVTGAHPFALVESAGLHEIKGIGDRLDGSAIVAIDINGLRLQNGERLAVDPAAQP